jgi:hypothetical protein
MTRRLHWPLLIIVALALAVPSAAAASDTLVTGGTLSAGQTLVSADSHYALAMQSDGNLVLYRLNGHAHATAIWATGTKGDIGDHAVLQSNGILALFDANGQALWSSGATTSGCSNLTVQSDGNLVLYDSTDHAYWASHTTNPGLSAGQVLLAGQSLFSYGGQYQITMQTDGNLVLYGPTGAVWSTRTWGHQGSYAVMQGDGDLVVYSPSGTEEWASNTGGTPGAYAWLSEGGNFYVEGDDKVLWQSGTSASRPKGPDRDVKRPFTACPPPPAPPAPAPATPAPVVTVPTPSPVPTKPKVKVRLTMSWTWDRAVTHLHRFAVAHLPARSLVTFTCHGRGCPTHRREAGPKHIRNLTRYLAGRAFRSGDLILITVTQPGHSPERVGIRILYGKLPRVRLMK